MFSRMTITATLALRHNLLFGHELSPKNMPLTASRTSCFLYADFMISRVHTLKRFRWCHLHLNSNDLRHFMQMHCDGQSLVLIMLALIHHHQPDLIYNKLPMVNGKTHWYPFKQILTDAIQKFCKRREERGTHSRGRHHTSSLVLI